MVADADRDCANTVVMLLNGAGMAAQVAYGGRAAIALANQCDPACAVIDIAMPEVSGLDVARHLRARYGADVRIVGYTSWTGREDRRRAAEAGFDTVVPKDADPFELLSALSGPTYEAVMRSVYASVRQMHLQMDLARALLRQVVLVGRPSGKVQSIVRRTLDSVAATLPRLPMGSAERASLEAGLADLRGALESLERE
jgi:CheY-like chemotaxis protein